MGRPRLLLVPQLTELEWRITPLLEEWAEAASYDAPGVGDEPPVDDLSPAAIAERGLREIDERGWDRYVVVADEFGAMAATRLASARPEAVTGLAIGHTCLENTIEGERPSINPAIQAAVAQIVVADYRTWALALSQVSQGSYDEEFADRYMERVPQELVKHFFAAKTPPSEPLEERLRALDCPFLFAEHKDCVFHTKEGFEDAAAAFPDAQTVRVPTKPSTSAEFADALRRFCELIAAEAPVAPA